MKYSGKLVFVTGGSEGIGKEVGREFYKAGANVILFSRSKEKLDAAKNDIGGGNGAGPNGRAGAVLEVMSLDVTDTAGTEKTLNAAMEKWGTPDYVINCAGYARPGYLTDLGIEHYRKMMELNYFGIVNICKAVVPALIKAKKGHIVNTSSMAGFIGLFGYTGYCASKYAVVGFSEGLRRELSPYGVKVSVLCPPNTTTPGLIEENKYKPAEVLKTEEKAKPVSPEYIAKSLLKEIPSGKLMIVPTFDGSMAYFLARHLPGVLSQFVKRPTN